MQRLGALQLGLLHATPGATHQICFVRIASCISGDWRELIRRHIHLLHARIHHGQHAGHWLCADCNTCRTRFFSHRQQGVNRQHRQICAKRQALRHRTCGAQTRERTRPTAKHHGLQIGQRHARLFQERQGLRNHVRRRKRTACAGMYPCLRAACNSKRKGVGAGL